MLHWVDIAIIGAYIAYSIWSGFGGAKAASQNLEEYYLAGRSLKGWQAGISMAATQFAADTPLTVAGLVAVAGVFSLWRFWIYALAFLLMALVLGVSWRRSGVITDAALTEVRYGGNSAALLRGTKAVYFGLVFNCVVLAMVLFATTRITEPFLTWHEWLPLGFHDAMRAAVEWVGYPLTSGGAACGVGGMCAEGFQCMQQRCIGPEQWVASTDNVISIGAIVMVTTLYSTTGGLRAVVKTDIAQFVIAMVATIAYAVVIIQAAGGMGEMVDQARALYPSDGSGPGGITADQMLAFTPSQAADVGFAFFAVLLLQWLCQLNADGSGYLAQRTMACRSDADAKQAGVVFAVTQVLFRSLFWLPIAVGLVVLFPPTEGLTGSALTQSREATYVRGIAELLPPGIMGLMVTGMLGALASTIDTHLNWGSSYFTNDIYRRFVCPHILKREPSPRSLVWVARSTNIVILLVALAVMPTLDSIRDAWETSLLFGAGVGAILVLRWLWWRMNATGELTALASSLILVPIVIWTIEDSSVRFVVMAAVPTVLAITVALLTPAEDSKLLTEFYERAKPPGFWGPFAAGRSSADRQRLWYSLAATFGTGFSIFAVLTAVGSWLIDSPPPVWFPWQGPWIALLLIAGLMTIPLWFRLVKKTRLPEPDSPPEVTDEGEGPSPEEERGAAE